MIRTFAIFTVVAIGLSHLAAAKVDVIDNTSPSRILVWEGVGNARDLGGLATVDGRRIRRGMVFRSQAFNDNAVSDWLSENNRLARKIKNGEILVEFGRKNAEEVIAQIDRNDFEASCARFSEKLLASKDNWRKGEPRGTEESRRKILAETGLKTELDLRSPSECWGMTGSPLGPEVRWVNVSACNIMQLDSAWGREAFIKCFRLFLDESNYPIDIHCIAGADRTGALAFMVEAAVGVREDEVIGDYVLTSKFNITERTAEKFRKMADESFSSYPGTTYCEKAVAYIKSCGFTDGDIEHLRSILLEDDKQGAEKERPVERDISSDESVHVILAQGAESVYNGHATMVRTKSGKLIAVWTIGHGGTCGPAAESTDNGRTWTRIDGRFPAEWGKSRNCPAIYSIEGGDGKERLFVFAGGPLNDAIDRNCGRQFIGMRRCVSEDDGLTWRMLPELPVTGIMPLTTMIKCADGSYLGMYNDRWVDSQLKRIVELKKIRDAEPDPEKRAKMKVKFQWNRVFQIRSYDGGFTWSEPAVALQSEEKDLCEPFLMRSDDGRELCVILRDNRKGHHGFGSMLSQLSISRDEGRTWSEPHASAPALSGHRHAGVKDSTGRWTIVSRCVDPYSPFKWHYCAWRGTYSDIVNRRPGELIKLVHGYPTDRGLVTVAMGRVCSFPTIRCLPSPMPNTGQALN